MKTLHVALIAFFLCLLADSLKAQTSKGGWLLGGSGSVRFTDPFYLDINPLAGYFVANNLVVGTQLPFNITTQRYSSSSLTTIGLTPFVRYYFLDTKLRPFLRTTMGYLRTYYRYEVANVREQVRYSEGYFNVSMGLGAVYFITPAVGLQAALDYRISRFATTTESDHHLLFSIGFGIYLSKNEK